jgi:hypothetical protein
VVPDGELMRVFVGPAVQPIELSRAAKTTAELRARAPAMWIEDPKGGQRHPPTQLSVEVRGY